MAAIEQVGIVGAGTMGSALAQKFAQEGLAVVLVDREDRFLKRGLESIRGTVQEGVSRGLFTADQQAAILARITPTVSLEELSRCRLVIEAVFEDRAVKEELFGRLGRAVPGDTILATNTSSFTVSELARSVARPERFLGLHFFYHAAKNRLVEVVRGEQTGEEVFSEALWFMRRCGKDPIVCRDAPGFVVNRFFVPWLNEAVRMHAEGLAGTGAIDAVARDTFGCGLGPFALMNATGVPIAYHAQRTLEAAYGKFYAPAEALERQARRQAPWEISAGEQLDQAAPQQIAERLLGVVFLVCGQLLDEKVCSAGDIERGAAIGLRWRRGPLALYHRHGEEAVLRLASSGAASRGLTLPQSLGSRDWRPDFVAAEKSGKTGVITLNRPEALNALNPEVVSQLGRAFDALEQDKALETIVIIGAGKAFVAGADITFFIEHIRGGTVGEIVRFTRRGQELFQRIDRSEKKVVAVVNGLALGGGLELALTADVIAALPTARLAFPETGIGIYPGLGGTQRTVDRIGSGLTKYLIYTGRMLSGRDVLEIGLVDQVIRWEELPALLRGELVPVRARPALPEKWRTLEAFFDAHTVDELLGGEPLGVAVEDEPWQSVLRQVRARAPLALRLAETLINARQGPLSELEHLEEIFATEDALKGLQSVGRKPPRFEGR